YSQDWEHVENFLPGRPQVGVHLKPWQELVEEEHQHIREWSSLVGAWNYDNTPKFHYGDDTTYKSGIAFLDGYGNIEDWGCGFAHAQTFVRRSHYSGLDGSSHHADKIVDLCQYRSDTDCIFMRHVLEHNLEWRRILGGAVASFRKRMVLILFTPFGETTHVITTALNCTNVSVPDISFRKADLTEYFRDIRYSEESVKTDTQYNIEHVFYLER